MPNQLKTAGYGSKYWANH